MNSVPLYFLLQLLCLHLNAFDITELSYSEECGTDGWEQIYRQTASNGGFPTGKWCTTTYCEYTPFASSDIGKFNELDNYKDSNTGAWAFTMAWDNRYWMQWEQGYNPVYASIDYVSTWTTTSYYWTFTVSDEMYQYGRLDFNGLKMSEDAGIALDGGSLAGAWYAIGVSRDMQLMDLEDGIPGFISNTFNYTAQNVQLWVWKPECGDWNMNQEPSVSPTLVPTPKPTQNPSMAPTDQPTTHPTDVPTDAPTERPTMIPTVQPTKTPTPLPTSVPSTIPTKNPTLSPTNTPTASPTVNPTEIPTTVPSPIPTDSPTSAPTPNPTYSPSRGPTRDPTPSPSPSPTFSPSVTPTRDPTSSPSPSPTFSPSVTPTSNPSFSPTDNPTLIPTLKPTIIPTPNPTNYPTEQPTNEPTASPTDHPTFEPTASPTDHPTFEPSQRPTSELRTAVVSVNTDSEPVSLIIITSVALLLFIIFIMFTIWLCMTKRVPRFSLCDHARGKSWKKKSRKYLNHSFSSDRSSRSQSHSDFGALKKHTKRRNSQIELYVVTPQGECESSLTEGSSLVEINTGTEPYYHEQGQKMNNPRLIHSGISTEVVTPDAYERSDSSSQLNPIINPSLVIWDSNRPQPIDIQRESSASSVKNSLNGYLPRETIEFRESEFCKARETRQVANMGLVTPREEREVRTYQNDVLNSKADTVSEGENSTSDTSEDSILSDLHPNTVSSHLDVQRIYPVPQGEMNNNKSIEYANSPGEDIAQRRQTLGTRYLNNLRIGDSFNVEPLLVTGEVTEEIDIFGIDSRVYEAKGAEVGFNKVN